MYQPRAFQETHSRAHLILPVGPFKKQSRQPCWGSKGTFHIFDRQISSHLFIFIFAFKLQTFTFHLSICLTFRLSTSRIQLGFCVTWLLDWLNYWIPSLLGENLLCGFPMQYQSPNLSYCKVSLGLRSLRVWAQKKYRRLIFCRLSIFKVKNLQKVYIILNKILQVGSCEKKMWYYKIFLLPLLLY